MNQSFREKIIKKLTRLGKKNKLLRIPMIIALTVFIGACDAVLYFANNGKRFLAITCVFLCFVTSSSFKAFVTEDVNAMEDEQTIIADSEVVLEDETVTDMHEMDLEVMFDDSDVMEGFTEEDFIFGADELETISIDDIMDEDVSDEVTSEEYSDDDMFSIDELMPEDTERVPDSKDQIVETYEDFVFDPTDWRYVLINKQHPIPDDYSFTLGTIKGDMQCDERILETLLTMMQAAKKDGVTLVICSPYRDYYKQEVLFERKINKYMNMGYNYLEAYKLSSQYVTVPGASEHQIGLAIDFISNDYRTLDYGFADCDAGKWLKEHCHEYGFILRYPKGKEYITGIDYEPWHFRFVGVEAATVIMNNELTLEEFTDEYLE